VHDKSKTIKRAPKPVKRPPKTVKRALSGMK
jgi:hypothetical protein